MAETTLYARRWKTFSLRTLLAIMGIAGIATFGKIQYDWHQKRMRARRWTEAVLADSLLFGKGGLTTAVPCPLNVSAQEKLELFDIAILHLESPRLRMAGLKIVVELYPGRAKDTFRRIIRKSNDSHLRATSVRLLALLRAADTVDSISDLLDDDSAEVRAAAADALGIIRMPHHDIPLSNLNFMGSPCATRTAPPIQIFFLTSIANSQMPQISSATLHREPLDLPVELRARIEAMMLSGKTAQERQAAARALVSWPPHDHNLRIAEWGIWINESGELKLAESVLDEIPPFVHRTGNSIESLKGRVAPIIFVDKPVLHLTADRPMAVDIECRIARGRPWFAYPRPDDFSIDVTSRYIQGPSPMLELQPTDNSSISPLREGYPWLSPSHRIVGPVGGSIATENAISSVGLRWQSVIVSPTKLPWMSPPNVPDDPRFSWWKKLRDVPCCWVSSLNEAEKFLYYDGPSLAKSPTDARLFGKELLLINRRRFLGDPHENDDEAEWPDLERIGMLISVDDFGAVTSYTVPVEGGESIVDLTDVTPRREEAAREAFREMLTDHGLTGAEANGLIQSWEMYLFEAPGKRLVVRLSTVDYDQLCPIKVTPTPKTLVRLGLVFKEFRRKHESNE